MSLPVYGQGHLILQAAPEGLKLHDVILLRQDHSRCALLDDIVETKLAIACAESAKGIGSWPNRVEDREDVADVTVSGDRVV